MSLSASPGRSKGELSFIAFAGIKYFGVSNKFSYFNKGQTRK